MLTDFELKWLEGRKTLCIRCDCFFAHLAGTASCHRGSQKGWNQLECRFFKRADCEPSKEDFEEAAKFEGIVAMMLSNPKAFTFDEPPSDKKEKSPFCKYCKIMGFAKLNKKKECTRTERECRRMNAMRVAEGCLLSGTLPLTVDPLEDEEQA